MSLPPIHPISLKGWTSNFLLRKLFKPTMIFHHRPKFSSEICKKLATPPLRGKISFLCSFFFKSNYHSFTNTHLSFLQYLPFLPFRAEILKIILVGIMDSSIFTLLKEHNKKTKYTLQWGFCQVLHILLEN